MRVHRFVFPAILALSLLSQVAAAERLGKGKSVVWVGLHGSRAEVLGPVFREHPKEAGELGLHLAYSYFLSNSWSVVGSGGMDVGGVEFQPPTGPTVRESINSWNGRIGFDRYAFIDDNVALYAGPGLLYWRGNAEGDGSGDTFYDQNWPTVSQFAFNGRLGMYARFGSHYALYGHIGQVIGKNRHESGGARVTWWTSHHEGSVGLAVDL